MKPFKPMLAVACEDITTLKYPLLASVKLDGIRASVHNGVVMSRSMKPIPSKAIQDKFGKAEYDGYDGEIIYGDVFEENVFNQSTRFCMSHDIPSGMGESNVHFYVFDKFDVDAGYRERITYIQNDKHNNVWMLPQNKMEDAESLNAFEADSLGKGAEGVMVRSMDGKYKQGRSTLKEGYLLKVKRFTDEEAIIVGFEEKMHNANEATVGELGQTKRSSHQENMIPCDTLGALVVYSEKWGEFRIGTGFNDALRKIIWDDRKEYEGKLVKFKYFATGVVDKPRFPVFLGIRHHLDTDSV